MTDVYTNPSRGDSVECRLQEHLLASDDGTIEKLFQQSNQQKILRKELTQTVEVMKQAKQRLTEFL